MIVVALNLVNEALILVYLVSLMRCHRLFSLHHPLEAFVRFLYMKEIKKRYFFRMCFRLMVVSSKIREKNHFKYHYRSIGQEDMLLEMLIAMENYGMARFDSKDDQPVHCLLHSSKIFDIY